MEGRPARIFNPTPIRKCWRAAVSGLNIIHPATHTRWMFMDSPCRWQVAHTIVPARRCSCLDAEAPPNTSNRDISSFIHSARRFSSWRDQFHNFTPTSTCSASNWVPLKSLFLLLFMLFGKIFIAPPPHVWLKRTPGGAGFLDDGVWRSFPSLWERQLTELSWFAGNAALHLLEMHFKISVSGDH